MQKTRATGECFQMSGVFYHSVIHSLGFFICFTIEILCVQKNKAHFFYVLDFGKTQVFDQSEHTEGPIFILVLSWLMVHAIKPFLYFLLTV